MPRLHLLDRRIDAAWPDLSTEAKRLAFEAEAPYAERVAAQSTYEALQRAAAHTPDTPALLFLPNADPDEAPFPVTHAQFSAQVTQAANAFGALGVGPGDVVSLLLPLVPQALVALFGAEAAGIANPVNPLLEAHQIAEILQAAGTKVLVTLGPAPGSDLWDKVQRIRGELPRLEAVLVVGAQVPEGEQRFEALLARQPADRLTSERRIAPGDTAAYFHTGGTTGLPKLVRHTHANQVYQAWACALMLRMTTRYTQLFGLPLFHVGGALTQALSVLSAGGTLVIVAPGGWRDPRAVRNVWRLVERYRPDGFGAVPTVLAAALNVPVAGCDVSSVRAIFGGGSAIPVAVGRAYEEQFGVPVQEVYGMTETSSVLTLAYIDRPRRLGSGGHAMPYSRVRVVKLDADGHCAGDCATNEIGVVAMHGPGVFSGYLSEQHNRGAFVEPGWVNSGDLGRLDEDGYLWLTGRAKDLIIRGGHNIDPNAIEDLFFGHPAVALAAVVGQPDAYAGELPVAYVQLRPGENVEPGTLRDFVAARAPERAAVPVQIHVVEAIPLTAVGKVFKPALRWDAARRAVSQMLAGVALPEGVALQIEVGAHPVHGSLITLRARGLAAGPMREALEQRWRERLDPLVMRHAIEWA